MIYIIGIHHLHNWATDLKIFFTELEGINNEQTQQFCKGPKANKSSALIHNYNTVILSYYIYIYGITTDKNSYST